MIEGVGVESVLDLPINPAVVKTSLEHNSSYSLSLTGLAGIEADQRMVYDSSSLSFLGFFGLKPALAHLFLQD